MAQQQPRPPAFPPHGKYLTARTIEPGSKRGLTHGMQGDVLTQWAFGVVDLDDAADGDDASEKMAQLVLPTNLICLICGYRAGCTTKEDFAETKRRILKV